MSKSFFKFGNSGFADAIVIAALACICISVLSVNFVLQTNDSFDSFNDIGTQYAEWVHDNRPSIYSGMDDRLTLAVARGDIVNTSNYGALISLLSDTDFVKDVILSVYDFLSSRGSFTDDCFAFDASADVSTCNLSDLSASIKSYADSVYNINSDVNFISWHMQREPHRAKLYQKDRYTLGSRKVAKFAAYAKK